jgi:hypothetical protein
MDLQSIGTSIATQVVQNPLLDVVGLLVLVLLVQTLLLSRRISLLARGADGKSLEHMVHTLDTRSQTLESFAATTKTALNNLDERLQDSVRGVAVRRFDPFQNSGGQQSFASAFLNEHGNGVVLSGIHARDGVRVYSKEIKNFISERELSDDEQAAIADAKKKL